MVEHLVPLLVVYMVLGLDQLPNAWGLQCDICDRSRCPPRDCPAGEVLDACLCCHVCARVVDQTCGGKFDIHGRCADNLVCRITPAVGTPVSEDHVGICKPELTVIDCDKAKCDVVFAPKCPADSIAIQSASQQGKCCPGPYKCQCKSCLSAQLTACRNDQVAVQVSRGTGKPGHCCDVFQCVDKDTACNGVVCEDDEFAAARCPADSYPLPPLHTNNGCCEKHQGCVCKSVKSCDHVTCGPGLRLRIIEPANGHPGSCCDKVQCVNKTGLVCSHDSVVRKDGDSWQLDPCTTCTCKNGLTFCRAASCEETVHCSWMGVPEGECCPVCRGCIADDGELYKNGESWVSKDGCVMCHCDEGHVYCQAEMCVIRCTHPRKLPGICCPVCDEETLVTVPPHCPPVNDCSLLCPNGRVRDADGCYLCQCNPETVIATELPSTTATSTEISEHGRKCLSLEGVRMHDGDSWYDGCRRCFCHHGREMCALITCPALKCHNPIMRVGDCCPSCGFEELPSSSTTSKCRTTDGRHVTDGDTWDMDECTQCICHEGGVLCEIESCPPILCHHPVKLPGRCCLACPDGNELLPLPSGRKNKNHCMSAAGVSYSSGDTWRVNGCQSCICQNSQIHCFSQSCPLLTCNETQLKKGQCCPHCPESVKLPSTSCVYKGIQHLTMERWLDGECMECICHQGQAKCSPIVCSKQLDCEHPIRVSGWCCPLCTNATVAPPVLSHHPNSVQSATPGVIGTQQTYNKGEGDSHKGYQVSIGILSVFVILLLLLVLLLTFLLRQRQRRPRKRGRSQMAEVCGINGKKKRPKSTNLDFQGINPLGNKNMPIYQKVFMDENFHCHVTDETINPLGNGVCGSLATGVCHNVAMDEMNIPCHSDNDLNTPLDVTTSTTDEDCHDVMTNDSDSCHDGVTVKQNISPACEGGIMAENDIMPVCHNAAMDNMTTDQCESGDTSGDTDSDSVLAGPIADVGDSHLRYSVGDERTARLLLDIPSVCDKENYRKSL